MHPSTSPTFHLFCQLPPELRLRIWSLTVSPRIVDILAFNKRLTPLQDRNPLKDDRVYTSQSSIPLLSVCRESRSFALGLYRHGLDTEDQRGRRFQARREEIPTHLGEQINGWHLPYRKNSQFRPGEIRAKIHFNLEEDVFCLNGVWWFVGRHPLYPLRNYLTSEILEGMRYLALPLEMFDWAVTNELLPSAPRGSRDARVTLLDFPNLREIFINMDAKEDERGERDPNQSNLDDIPRALEGLAKRNPGWKIPKWRLVKDRLSLETVIQQGLLT